jgi:hypothetical protein
MYALTECTMSMYKVLASGWFAIAETCYQLCVNYYMRGSIKIREICTLKLFALTPDFHRLFRSSPFGHCW